ncbi:response regulator [Paralimibaculum aggregatum]|uniref:Response regulator n=1 Tax=Paralimibaculum aggregatum TaxID=3036245 RepID=A0ABQ6LL97_9RHOB|nr:response regulator [Limibaculum sp. NKW23]GMG82018.1 response regulator [Limibaculum sp. NKW23]
MTAIAQPDAPRILICDDEEHLREMVGEYLGERGFRVAEAGSAAALHRELAGAGADLVILDITMPGEDGLSALRKLRTEFDLPVIMLTAASEVIDRVVGLEMGADDYLGKPVDLRELEARIKAALRRHPSGGGAGAAGGAAPGSVPFGPCKLDLDRASLTGPEGEEIPITAMEFSLLRVLAENRGRVLTRDQLLAQAHDRGWEPFDRSIDLRISRLRRKIEPNPAKPSVIRTVRGVGYIFG